MEEIWRLFESAEHEELCARLEKDGSLGKVLCKEASCKVTRLAGDVKNAALLHACAIAAAMRGIEDEMVAYRDARISGGVGMRKDSEAFSTV